MAHNPEVVGSSPASATIKNTGFRKKSGVFLTFERNIIYQFRFDTNSDANAERDWWFLYAIGCITKNNSYRQDAPIRVIAHIL